MNVDLSQGKLSLERPISTTSIWRSSNRLRQIVGSSFILHVNLPSLWTYSKDHPQLVSTIDKAVQKGALHKSTAGRKKSRAARLRAGA